MIDTNESILNDEIKRNFHLLIFGKCSELSVTAKVLELPVIVSTLFLISIRRNCAFAFPSVDGH